MKYDSEQIGKLIKDKRINYLNWSQQALGHEVGVSGKQISKYESGSLIPPLDVLFKLCEIFECELGYLLGEEDYSEGTKLGTAISNYLGIDNNAIDAIRSITGADLKGYANLRRPEYFRITFIDLITNSSFPRLIGSMGDLDKITKRYNSIWPKMKEKYSEAVFNQAHKYFSSTTDYVRDPNAPVLDPIYYDAINDIENAIDELYNTEFPLKVARYDTRESFEELLRNLYPVE